MGGRTFSADAYRYGFNGKENDREWGESLIQDYGFRLYSPAIGKFLSVDPLAPSYPWNSTYAFAENRVINGIDLDGLEWVLRITSPSLSTRFKEALDAKDLYEMRAIAHYGRTHYFKSDYGLASLGLSENSPAAQLYYNPNAPKGVTVILHDWADGDVNSGVITPLPSEEQPSLFEPYTGDNFPEERFYPVDVEYGDDDVYGDYEYVGISSAQFSSATIGGKGVYRGDSYQLAQGKVEGFGFFEFDATSEGISLGISAGSDSAPFSYGSYRGKGIPTLENFSGVGHILAVDIDVVIFSIGYTRWTGGEFASNPIWSGNDFTIGYGFGLKLIDTHGTSTSIVRPRTDRYSVNEEAWSENLIPREHQTPVINHE